jgi:hypothetical protein
MCPGARCSETRIFIAGVKNARDTRPDLWNSKRRFFRFSLRETKLPQSIVRCLSSNSIVPNADKELPSNRLPRVWRLNVRIAAAH